MKQFGFEVVATKPVCVDFRDGRAVSFRPGQRFTAALTNPSIQRLLRVQEIRQLGDREAVPPLPPKLGAPQRVQNIMTARAEVQEARRLAEAKLAASRKAPPKIEEAKPAPKPKKPENK